MRNATQTLLFAGVLGVVCSALLTGASLFTAPYRAANEKAEEVRNYLAALDAPVPENASAAELLKVFDRHVRRVERNGLTLYEYRAGDAGELTAVAAPISGPGVWGAIEGVLALEPDMLTIRGVRFFRQEETPGLGGEIAADWFLNQFRGRKIVSRDGTPGFLVRRVGTVNDQNAVDAVTGATATSDRVESMLDRVAKQIGRKQ